MGEGGSVVSQGLAHEAEHHRDTGWCERCKQDEARPIYEVISPTRAGNWKRVDYRYFCECCAKAFTKLSIPAMLKARKDRLAMEAELRPRQKRGERAESVI